jgi:hypothetical protein
MILRNRIDLIGRILAECKAEEKCITCQRLSAERDGILLTLAATIQPGSFIVTQDDERLMCIEARDTGWGDFTETQGGTIYKLPLSGLKLCKDQLTPQPTANHFAGLTLRINTEAESTFIRNMLGVTINQCISKADAAFQELGPGEAYAEWQRREAHMYAEWAMARDMLNRIYGEG